jgi:hypothetical protein
MTELERALVALGNELEFPATPDVWWRVAERVQRRRWFRPAAFAVAVGALAIGIAFAVPPARSAILRFFHIGAATVERVETLPPAQRKPLVAGLGPALAKPTLRVPKGTSALGYYARPGLRAALLRYRGKQVLLAEISGNQMAFGKKAVEKQTLVEPVDLGESGLWLEGPEHVLLWQFQSGVVHFVETRLAGNVLLWLRNGVTYRLEGDLGKVQMLALARRIS